MNTHPSFNTWYMSLLKVLAMTTGEIELDDTLWDEDGNKVPQFDMAATIFFFITILLTITLMNLIISLSVESLGPMIEKVELWSLEHALFNIVIFQEKTKIQDKKLSKMSRNFQLFFYGLLVKKPSESPLEFLGECLTRLLSI